MGTWGYGLFDNDAAGDLVVVWDRYVEPGRRMAPESWSGEQIYEFFRSTYFRQAIASGQGVRHGETALEVLALGSLFLEHEMQIPAGLRQLLADAANHELRKEQLKEWASPRKRERALLDFLATVGGERAAEVAASNPLKDDVRRWREFSKQYPRWIRLVKERKGGDEEAERIWPRDFFDQMGRTIGRGTSVSDWKLRNAAYQQRLMATAFLMGWWLDLPEEQTLALIEAAKQTGGEVPALHYLGTPPE